MFDYDDNWIDKTNNSEEIHSSYARLTDIIIFAGGVNNS